MVNKNEFSPVSGTDKDISKDGNCEKGQTSKDKISPAREQILLQKLIKRDAQLQKEQKMRMQAEKERSLAEKNYNTVTNSSLWRLSWPARKSFKMMKRTFNYLKRKLLGSKYITLAKEAEELAVKNSKLERQVKALKVKLDASFQENKEQEKQKKHLQLQLQELDGADLTDIIKQSKDEGEIIEVLDLIIRNRASLNEDYTNALKFAAKSYINTEKNIKYMIYEKVLKGLQLEEIPEFITREAEKEPGLPLNEVSSFKSNLTRRLRLLRLGKTLPEWILDNKSVAYSFIDNLKIRRPWVSDEIYKFTELPKHDGIVIKPRDGAGSRGVYLLSSLEEIQDVKRSQTLNGWEELETFVKEDFSLGWVDKDEWIIEELVYETIDKKIPARDIKFYCFYGKVGLILEVVRYPEVKYCWWSPEGALTDTGKYKDQLFEGNGVTAEHIKQAEKISLEIPAPFVRIDFLKTGDELVFGEFTPKPGNYDHFNHYYDKLLGDYILEAEHRLVNDLLSGKQFQNYKTINSK
ncbi:ATP-grasp fold amidoligase family protein [Evansella clarkii]|uniref:ATP-grasp fold amidoligase family protein n=1 Tax=Evansella clarkii TaxID=79879 RepID=UPI000998C4DD|nr:ATP-grasp fold amidoligase family protein [Evansella clarkii]